MYIYIFYVQHIDVDMYYMDFQVLNSHFDILSGQVSVKKDLTPFLEKCSAKLDEAQKWCRCICGSPDSRKSPHHRITDRGLDLSVVEVGDFWKYLSQLTVLGDSWGFLRLGFALSWFLLCSMVNPHETSISENMLSFFQASTKQNLS